MFISVKALEVARLVFQEEFPAGSIDFRTRDFRQVAPLRAEGWAELLGNEIRLAGKLATRLELTCARCLEPVAQEVAAGFDLLYRPVSTISREEELSLTGEDLELGFYVGQGLFLADALAEQVHLALPMKMLCREECRGLCPHCGANLNRERCKCEARAVDPRLAPLARIRAEMKGDS
ncbi:MAG TPA: DUF177 domain-containing protein [Candidatus Xenobia bacterium]|nr:DUF177 domain-containing protein [Candidatus Xenobia bacterium]